MIILPAIDLINGECVRLTQGDYATSEKVAGDPLETALSFRALGAAWLHMVDLDGATAKKPKNQDVILRVAAASGLNVEVGGGIRTMETIESYLDGGAARVILGSVALTDPELVANAVAAYGDKIAVGIDAKNGIVRTNGWLDDGEVRFTDLAKKMSAAGVETIIYTDISKDGTLSGPNLDELKELADAVPEVNVIASGGIHDILDLIALKSLGLYGAICGKSIYKGTLKLDQAVAAAAV
ncbi:MAG: 1-(5-phosphoribosyl)-5-[(5-phosphoribosylamino)methylideneamino]imidazole-4-carboxamide isomerase [Clostridiales Family XIII bacterium]|jgi:phosphoribosylformimino-5-aminoimidazole carboxamide ribotide isomerase|nr:1-(5-phosphoribosyl)-5-[(5-phosphoribosylamino)methylideneamino]imidazole-4-carboxamide isomerase [Clostridiales Family XIII bacterium]